MRAASTTRHPYAAPPAALRAHVDRIWSWQSTADASLPTLLPGTGAELVVSLGAPLAMEEGGRTTHLPDVFVFCLRSGFCALRATGSVDLISVRFRGNGLRHFSAWTMADLADRLTPGSVLFGAIADDLVPQLRTLPSFERRAEALAKFLEGRLARFLRDDAREDRLAQALYYGEPTLPVRHLASELGTSVRQLERSLLRTSGLSPKRYRRIARLHLTMRDLHLRGTADYLDAALARGFHDQAHFIHECRDLIGRTPRQILTPAQLKSHFYNTSLRA
ncbi:hypothetical protein DB347_03845 [Opitutaceae bacterium EW11]|nr:hypothetical protein DB347_03845 [Opitutaceae bacterium EW11]